MADGEGPQDKPGSNEIFPPPAPEGYRAATPEEEQEILKHGLAVQVWDAKAKQHDAELRAARLELQQALSQLMLAQQQLGALHARLGIKGEQGDLLEEGGRMFLLTDPAKRISQQQIRLRNAVKAVQKEPPNEKKEAP